MLLAAGLLVLSYVSVFFNPAKAWFMSLFGLLFPVLWLLDMGLFIWALWRRSRAAWIPALALLPTVFIVGQYYQFSSPKEDPSDRERQSLSVLSYNVGRFLSSPEAQKFPSSEKCADSLFSMIRGVDADIVCLQEFHWEDSKEVGKMLKKKFPGYNVEYFVYPTGNGCFGNVTLSRYPVTGKGQIDFDESANLSIWTDVKVGKEKFRIYNCHFQSYNFSLPRFAKSLRKDYKSTLKDTEDKLKISLELRHGQVDQVMGHIEDCPLSSFVVGDFNDTPLSYTYNHLCSGRSDSFVMAGKGFGATYAYMRPFIRIDYILIPRQYRAISHTVMKNKLSDHYPILSTIVLEGKEDKGGKRP